MKTISKSLLAAFLLVGSIALVGCKAKKEEPKIKGEKEILYPGENKYNRYKKNFKKEIKITKEINNDISSLLSKI